MNQRVFSDVNLPIGEEYKILQDSSENEKTLADKDINSKNKNKTVVLHKPLMSRQDSQNFPDSLCKHQITVSL